jgi:polyisoprenoid-binding protein YceI
VVEPPKHTPRHLKAEQLLIILLKEKRKMSKNVLIGIGVVGILILVGAAAYVLRPTAEASAPIEAIPVEVEQPAAQEPQSAEGESDPVENAEKTADSAMPAVKENAVDEMVNSEEESKEEMSAADESAEEVDKSTSDGVIVFTIVPAESEVRFTLGELLNGVPTTVVGTTDQVAGEIAIDPAAPASSKVGVILVNARTFVTDSSFRNRAINNSILETGKYEFVTFTPTEIIGFPDDPALGQALNFQVSGDLTVRDITHPITFDVTVTAVSETRLEGSASAMLSRADYDLQIPEVPRVADVDEEVLLEIDFVAVTK